MRLQGKTALVTGSTRGIGLGIARAFAREGAAVVVTARSGKDCQAVAEEIGKEGRRAIAIPADLSKSEEVRRLARDAESALGGRVDILVNNAGQPRVAPSVELPEADYRYTLDLNLNAYFLLSQETGRGMLSRRSGAIVNVSSVNGTLAFPQRLAYCVAKAGVNMLTKVLAIEWAGQGVRVNAIAPGYVATEMVKGLAAKGILDQERLSRRTPMGRLGLPEEVAEAAVFLASDAATFITGSVLTVDGGWMAYGYL
ncbi:MAG: 3-oxoacyl-ACP reductase FabG [Candidatus Rokubacteria bacterium]|nr:3-oxoacyl-ACP reductase FabG [Candidatus Rokubacteria bacterium]